MDVDITPSFKSLKSTASDLPEVLPRVSGQPSASSKLAMIQKMLHPSRQTPLDGEWVEDPGLRDLFQDMIWKQSEMEAFAEKQRQAQEAFKAETDVELQQIKGTLEARERELLAMLRELEEAKELFTAMRGKAAMELTRAQNFADRRQHQLEAMQPAASALKQVTVEYWGPGTRVQLAGSFNGWEHNIDMQPDLSSAIPQGTKGRPPPMLWSVTLLLYPGKFQLKFIVDGKWKVDERRPMVHTDMGPNNVLHVKH